MRCTVRAGIPAAKVVAARVGPQTAVNRLAQWRASSTAMLHVGWGKCEPAARQLPPPGQSHSMVPDGVPTRHQPLLQPIQRRNVLLRQLKPAEKAGHDPSWTARTFSDSSHLQRRVAAQLARAGRSQPFLLIFCFQIIALPLSMHCSTTAASRLQLWAL